MKNRKGITNGEAVILGIFLMIVTIFTGPGIYERAQKKQAIERHAEITKTWHKFMATDPTDQEILFFVDEASVTNYSGRNQNLQLEDHARAYFRKKDLPKEELYNLIIEQGDAQVLGRLFIQKEGVTFQELTEIFYDLDNKERVEASKLLQDFIVADPNIPPEVLNRQLFNIFYEGDEEDKNWAAEQLIATDLSEQDLWEIITAHKPSRILIWDRWLSLRESDENLAIRILWDIDDELVLKVLGIMDFEEVSYEELRRIGTWTSNEEISKIVNTELTKKDPPKPTPPTRADIHTKLIWEMRDLLDKN